MTSISLHPDSLRQKNGPFIQPHGIPTQSNQDPANSSAVIVTCGGCREWVSLVVYVIWQFPTNGFRI